MKYKVIVYYDNMPDSEHILVTRTTLSTNCIAYEVLNIAILGCIQWRWSNAVDSASSTHNG